MILITMSYMNTKMISIIEGNRGAETQICIVMKSKQMKRIIEAMKLFLVKEWETQVRKNNEMNRNYTAGTHRICKQ